MKNYFFILVVIASVGLTFSQKQKDEPTTYEDDLSLDWKRKHDTLKLVAKNKLLTPIQIYFHSKKDSTTIKSFLVPSKDSIELLKYIGNLPDSIYKSKLNDSIRVNYFWGHRSVIKPDLDHLYRFPFKSGKKYRVSQSFNGKVSHSSKVSKYAIDFQLEVGEPVHVTLSTYCAFQADQFNTLH